MSTAFLTRPACHDCPFRESDLVGYCADGLEALSEGHEPACHKVVGRQAQFETTSPSDDQICQGYLAYENGEPGFRLPILGT